MGQIANGYYNAITWKKHSLEKQFADHILQLDVESDDDYLLFLKLENHCSIPNIDKLIASLELIYNENTRTFVVLTPRKNPPPYTATEEEFVFSFSCQVQYFKSLISYMNKATFLSTQLLFELLDQITTGKSGLEKLLIRQFPFKADKEASINNCDVIIPHRGDNEYLSNVLSFLTHAKPVQIYVGIDQELTNDVITLKRSFPDTAFYIFTPSPVGPYIIRNRLINQGRNNLIFFQDSDDIPCTDRFEKIAEYMNDRDCQLCGSHELRMDYYRRTVQAVRFPLDVLTALKSAPWHSLLHPASAIQRKAFYECGGLSEERTFGNDTKFLLRSFFTLSNMKNVDEFLYIRKLHPGSLTTSPDTMLGSPLRRKLLHLWNSDFEEIKSGTLQLEVSSLQHEGTKLVFKMNRL